MEVIPLAQSPDSFGAADLSLAESAILSLLQELETYPKPGLVSMVDSGAHADMDYALMCRSAHALLHPFARITAAGRKAGSFESMIVPLGLAAERDMLHATDGINTHRGAIFSLGMILAALALVDSASKPLTSAHVRAALLDTWGDALQAHALSGGLGASHGAVVRRTTGSGGARVEAARGFPGIFEIGVPAYRAALAADLDFNASRVHTLFVLMEAVEDTNVLFRGGPEAASFVRQSAGQFLAEGGCRRAGWFDRAEELHRKFIQRNLSPGGSADLLSGTLLVASACPPS
jgi:triphosphoribosyl-dephospho-CoA synthase